ncbi:MAG TPA: hypothetical protein DCE39_02620 [Planctomycetaceae bacterium]|nr:hypothetical protein [Planctomycetaceae bacterium]
MLPCGSVSIRGHLSSIRYARSHSHTQPVPFHISGTPIADFDGVAGPTSSTPEQEDLPMTNPYHWLLTILLLGVMVIDAEAEIVIRKSGSSWAKVDDDGTIRIRGRSVGRFESNGTVRKRGSSVGSIDSDGTIRRRGRSVGKIESNGTVRRRGYAIGRIESGGTIRKKGSSWGSASNCCGSHGGKKAVAAVLVFFADDYFDN